MIPQRLEKGDEIRVLALSSSMGQEWMNLWRDFATKRFEKLGYKLTFGKHVLEIDEFGSSSVQSRVSDFHDAIKDKNVKMIISVIGGFNSNELLDHVDYDLVKLHPKIICGYSDITAFTNAIHTITGLVTYSGPAYFSFGMKQGFEYSLKYFEKALCSSETFAVIPPNEWSDDKWASHQDKRIFHAHEGYKVFNTGFGEGRIVGGNLCTLNMLQGTKYMPSLKDSILFIEESVEGKKDIQNFKRNLQSLIQQKDFSAVKGVVFAKFESGFNLTDALLKKIVFMHPALEKIPILTNVDFGHTFPQITFPIGGTAQLDLSGDNVSLKISQG